jgi:SNF2 family DNA or RNA helicase
MTKPAKGQIVRARTRFWLVEQVTPSLNGTLVQLACVDDDAQGELVEVVWEVELDATILDGEAWGNIGKRDFDRPEFFAAYLNTLRWNCVTSTNEKLFQAPFRAGIRIDAYQLEPLRKALALARVNMFIADDVGLGKTIEAGVIANELRLRRRVNEIVVACPPSMTEQWQEEMESRFGLTFEIFNRDYVEHIRRERGYATNPWTTFPRWIVSHRLLIDEAYAGPLKQWLDSFRPGSLLILDEAHHAAPASGSKYAIDSKFTQAIRELAPRFEHRLFLSATPHNGHSNSFSALLELLDDKRFTRGVPVLKSSLDAIMVRRLKDDIRELDGGFPRRIVEPIEIDGLPADAPELILAERLVEYREVRKARFASGNKREQAMGGLILSTLQQRLFSSLEAFYRTLGAHRRAMERVWAGETISTQPSLPEISTLTAGWNNDEEAGILPADEQEQEAAEALAAATQRATGNSSSANPKRERELLDQMGQIAGQNRFLPDARIKKLLEWLRQNVCAGISSDGTSPADPNAPWKELRVIIFTEYEDTARYLRTQLELAIGGPEYAQSRIAVWHGPSNREERKAIKHAFNESPSKNPLRILIATDAAREGLNLQAHCWNLFHVDLPWNPSRLEQRNGRIDRKLQPNNLVYCRYFVYAQRPEDRVLAAIVRKTETIRRELGCLSEVIDSRLASGIERSQVEQTASAIENAAENQEKQKAREEELEEERQVRLTKLKKEIELLRNRIEESRDWINLREDHFRAALGCALELDGVAALKRAETPTDQPQRYNFPDLLLKHGGDSGWAETLDTLRTAPEPGENIFQWRNRSPLRPIVFSPLDGLDEDVVQVHLSHRIVQRLLGRFLTQGFVLNDLSRACLAQTADAIPRVILVGRLAVYGQHATRLHEELIIVTARWSEPGQRGKALSPYGREAEKRTLQLMEEALTPGAHLKVPKARSKQLHETLTQDIAQLLPHLQKRGETALAEAQSDLKSRGEAEAENLKEILREQRNRVVRQLGRYADDQMDLPGFTTEEKKQLKANQRHWKAWLENVEGDIAREPNRIREFYQTESHRIEPVGIAYLWPVTG